MPIEVRHDPRARVIVQAAELIGRGQRADYEREQARQDADEALRRQQFEQGQYEFETNRADTLDRMAFQSHLNDQSADHAATRQQQQADANVQHEKDLFDYKWTAEQQRQLAQINASIQEVDQSTDLTPEEKAWAKKQLETKRWGIQPLPIPKPQPQPTVKEAFDNGQIMQAPNGGYFVRQPDGKIEWHNPPKKDDEGDKAGKDARARVQKVLPQVIKDLTKVDADGNTKAPSDEEVLKEAKRRIQLEDRLVAEVGGGNERPNGNNPSEPSAARADASPPDPLAKLTPDLRQGLAKVEKELRGRIANQGDSRQADFEMDANGKTSGGINQVDADTVNAYNALVQGLAEGRVDEATAKKVLDKIGQRIAFTTKSHTPDKLTEKPTREIVPESMYGVNLNKIIVRNNPDGTRNLEYLTGDYNVMKQIYDLQRQYEKLYNENKISPESVKKTNEAGENIYKIFSTIGSNKPEKDKERRIALIAYFSALEQGIKEAR